MDLVSAAESATSALESWKVCAATVRAPRERHAAHHKPVARTVIIEVLLQLIELLYAPPNPEASTTAGMRPGNQRWGRVKHRGGNLDGSVLHPRRGGRRFKSRRAAALPPQDTELAITRASAQSVGGLPQPARQRTRNARVLRISGE